MEKKTKFHMMTPQIIALGFIACILAGTLLLMLPWSTAPGETTHIIDALFTATTSICVTGLVTVTTATHWSLFGKIVILLLIQLGGLGIIAVSIGVLMVFGRRISLRDKQLIQDAYGLDSAEGLAAFVKKVIAGTFAAEGIGAVLMAFDFVPKYGLKGIWYAVFHSVSAFCNAGLDLIGDDSLCASVGDCYLNLVMIALIVAGGIGFVVWWDIGDVLKEERAEHYGHPLRRLQLHTKLTLVTTAILIVGGTVLFLIFEWNNPDSVGTFSPGKKLLACLFESVTLRTAGFQTIHQESLTRSSTMVCLLLMIIGGSSTGTAGGIKTTTAAMLFLMVWSQVRGDRETEVFGRRISTYNLKTAIAILGIFLSVLAVVVCVLFQTESFGTADILFEACSALGTTGLTRGITPQLTVIGKLLIIFLMYLGRIGPITLAMSFMMRRRREGDRVLPERRILIG